MNHARLVGIRVLKFLGLRLFPTSGEIVYAAEVHHRGGKQKGGISWALTTRSGFRRGRRTRNLRHRPTRWKNRKRKVPVSYRNRDGNTNAQRAPEGMDETKSQNDFNRVSLAMFLDKRYRWERLPRTKTNVKQKKRVATYPLSSMSRSRKMDRIAPSLMSRVFNLETWTRRLCKVYPMCQTRH